MTSFSAQRLGHSLGTVACLALIAACSSDPEPDRLGSFGGSDRRIGVAGPRTENGTTGLQPLPEGQNLPIVLAPSRMTLPGGIRLGITEEAGDWCDLRLTFAHRKALVSQSGTARVAARLVAESPLDDARRPSLERQIEQLGGRLRLDVDPWTTAFDIRIPTAAWRDAAQLLFESVSELPKGVQRAEEITREETRDLVTGWMEDPTGAMVDRLRSYDPQSIDKWVDEAESTTLTSAQTFVAANYVAAGTVVLARVPGTVDSLAFLSGLAGEFTKTRPGQPVTPEAPPPPGLFWAPRRVDSDRATIAWVFDLPGPGRLGAEFERTILELLTADGVGGRIGAEIRRTIGRSLVFETEVATEGLGRRLTLRAEIPAEAILPLRNVVQRAVASLKNEPPTPEEWRAAGDRALLRLDASVADRDGYLDLATVLLKTPGVIDTHRLDEDRVIPLPPTQADPFATTAALFRSLEPGPLRTIIESMAERPNQLVALGGSPSEGPGIVRVPRAEIDPERFAVASADDEVRIQKANESWTKALQALGGPMRCASVLGYRSASTTRTGRGPEMHNVSFVASDGRLRQERRILATDFEIKIAGESATQRVQGKVSPIATLDATGIREEALRHPLMLAGRAARGQDRYRQISLREAYGRRLAVLERIDDPLSLQVWIDTGSGLIRVVRSLETRAAGRVWVREEWFDYRETKEGLRAPFQMHRMLDDAARGTATEWVLFDPRRPSVESLEGQ